MSIWAASPCDQEPEITLTRWRIWRTDSGSDHLVGERADLGTGRVSSAVQHFDLERKLVTTRSGRKYKLLGPPGYSDDAKYVWDGWCRLNRVERSTDVTLEIYPESR